MHVLLGSQALSVAARGLAGALVAGFVASCAWRLRALDARGAVAAWVVGIASYAFGGLLVATAMLLFFISGSLLGRIRNKAAEQARRSALKGARRDAWQVLANGGAAAACAVVAGTFVVEGHLAERWLFAAVGALAAASGDTWSTEVGALYGGAPILITTLRRVRAGVSGGISAAGTLAAPAGGALVGLAGLVRTDLAPLGAWLGVAALAGLAGSLADSLVGATLQGRWSCEACGIVIESDVHQACGTSARHRSGLRWLNNDGVNLIASLCGAAIGYACGRAT